jgi:hypothetical protein
VPVGVPHHLARYHATLRSLSPHGYLRTRCAVAQATEEPLCGNPFADAQNVRGAPGSHPAVRADHAARGPWHALRDLLKHVRLPRFHERDHEREAGHSGPKEQTHGQSGIERAY